MCAKAAALVQPHDYLVSLSLVIPATRKGECVCVWGGGAVVEKLAISLHPCCPSASVIGCEEGEHKDVTMKEERGHREKVREERGCQFLIR